MTEMRYSERTDLPRDIALRILYDIDKNKAYGNISLDKHLENNALKDLDISFVNELVHGILKRKLTLDHIISLYSNIKLEKISVWIINILRLGVYQLFYLSRVPASASVNESVKLAVKYGHRASANFVNAVLRNIDRNRERLVFPDQSDAVKHLSVKHSYPEWLVRRWVNDYGLEFAENLMQAGNEKPDYIIRVNTLRTNRDELFEKLNEKGFKAKPGRYLNDTLRLENPAGILKSEEYRNGLFIVQDESSMLPVRVLEPQPGQLLIDVCSAPGGKAAYAATLMNNKGRVIAKDIYENKLELIRQTSKRLGLDIIQTEAADASVAGKDFIGKADRVLADVPCTGFGIIRRKPDIKWSRKEQDIRELSLLQKRILRTSAEYLKPGGIIVYSTCTFGKEENESLIEEFLRENSGFEPVPFDELLPEGMRCFKKGMLQLYPNVHETDGFFIAKMRKIGEGPVKYGYEAHE